MLRLGIDIGGTKINLGLLDENNRLLGNRKLYVAQITSLSDSLKAEVESLCAELGVDAADIVSCGVGVPGTVSEDGKRLLKAPNIAILSENVTQELEKALQLPVTLVQDSRAAAWGEYVCGAGVGGSTVVCITLGTGIGTGMVIDGKIYHGALGSAGEMGHIPVAENGRSCGCGKTGCLEKYCAGGGLDITARELLGEGKTAADLFAAAKDGDAAAAGEISKAVKMLGNAVVSIINLISPDCILFSGGLSEQEEMYLNPLIAYVQEHCYSSGRIPRLEKAALGENSPLIGAALVPTVEKRKALLSASVMCADVMHMEQALQQIEDAGIQYIHCDIMDNHFVPNLMLPMELLNQLHQHSRLPFDYHIMAENPQTIIDKLLIREGDYVSIHYESTHHLQRVITAAREKGAKVAVAINPATPISVLEEVMPEVDMILLMTVNPGFSGQKIVPTSFDKIKKLRKMLDQNGYRHIPIEVDGNCSFENVPKMYAAGAEIFVVGTSSVFRKDMSIREGTQRLYELLP